MTDTPSARRSAEVAGEIRYLSIHLMEYVMALPTHSIPPRGRPPWSVDEVTLLADLTRSVPAGEREGARAGAALERIAALLQREATVPADAGALLADYLAQRAIVLDSLPRLQRIAFGPSAATPPRAEAPAARAGAPPWARALRWLQGW